MEHKHDLIVYRIERADENFEAAQLLFEHNKLFNSVSALYYSAFQIVLAVLLTKEIRIKTHKSVLNSFSKYFIKTKIFPIEYGRLFNKLQDYRSHADYGDFTVLSKSEVSELIKLTMELKENLKQFIENR